MQFEPRESSRKRFSLRGGTGASVGGTILTAPALNAHNTFDKPDNIKPEPFAGASLKDGNLKVSTPQMSVVVLEIA